MTHKLLVVCAAFSFGILTLILGLIATCAVNKLEHRYIKGSKRYAG